MRHHSVAGGLSTAASSALGRLIREGPCRLADLARSEAVSQPNMTHLVTCMERAGLVRRVADHNDGRAVLVEVTDTGLDVFRQRRAGAMLVIPFSAGICEPVIASRAPLGPRSRKPFGRTPASASTAA